MPVNKKENNLGHFTSITVDDETTVEEIEPSKLLPDNRSMRALACFPELLPEHTKLIKEAENASETATFWVDDSKTGIGKFIIKEK